MSDELRTRVLEAAHDLGYEANAVARSLKTRRSHTIALITSDIGNPFFTSVVRGVEDVDQRRAATRSSCATPARTPEREEAYLRMLGAQRVDGLILVPSGDHYPYLDRLLHTKSTIVLLDRVLSDVTAPAVTLDSVDAARVATRHLVGLGHRRIGLVAPRGGTSSARGAHRRLPDGAGAVGHRVRPGAGRGTAAPSWRRRARPRAPCSTCPTGPRR